MRGKCTDFFNRQGNKVTHKIGHPYKIRHAGVSHRQPKESTPIIYERYSWQKYQKPVHADQASNTLGPK